MERDEIDLRNILFLERVQCVKWSSIVKAEWRFQAGAWCFK